MDVLEACRVLKSARGLGLWQCGVVVDWSVFGSLFPGWAIVFIVLFSICSLTNRPKEPMLSSNKSTCHSPCVVSIAALVYV